MKMLLLSFGLLMSFSVFANETGKEYVEKLVKNGMNPFAAIKLAFEQGSKKIDLDEYAPSCTDDYEIMIDSGLRSSEFHDRDSGKSLIYEKDLISCRLISRTDPSRFIIWREPFSSLGRPMTRDITKIDGNGYHGYLKFVDNDSQNLRLISFPKNTSSVFTVRKFKELIITQQITRESGTCECENLNGKIIIEAYRMTWKDQKKSPNE